MKLCGIPVLSVDEAPSDHIAMHPALVKRIEQALVKDTADYIALKRLYHAIIAMKESGIGYSPETSEAMKALKLLSHLDPARPLESHKP